MQSFVNSTKNDKVLIELLKKSNWDVNNAVEEYFVKGYGEKAAISKSTSSIPKIQQSFNLYKDGSSGRIEGEGIQKFFSDLGVDPLDPITLLISMYMKAQTMGFYTYEEYETGMKALSCSTAQEMRKSLPQLYQELKDPLKFKEFYKYVFDFSRDQGFTNVSMETAVGLWELLLADKCTFLKDWILFLQTDKKEQEVVKRDTWYMLLELIQSTDGNFKNFVDDGAWPSLIDSFNEFYQKKQGKH